MTRHMTGFVYVISGLLVIFVGVLLTGAMLGMTTAIFSVTSLLVAPLFIVGPSLLILTGITEIAGRAHQHKSWTIAGGTLLSLLAAWTIPSVGWRLATWLILEPVAVALLIAAMIMLAVRKSWIEAMIGSAVSAPFFLYGSATTIYSYFSNGVFTWLNFWLFAPAVLLVYCFILALNSRQSWQLKHGMAKS
jgi:hypothetical protein